MKNKKEDSLIARKLAKLSGGKILDVATGDGRLECF